MSPIFNNWRNLHPCDGELETGHLSRRHIQIGVVHRFKRATTPYKGRPTLQLSLKHDGKTLSEDIEAEVAFRYQSNAKCEPQTSRRCLEVHDCVETM